MEKISFCIPCYRSEKTIKTVIKEIEYEMNKTTKYDYEIVCVVDGSPDDVFGVLCDLGKNNRRIKVVNLARNFGQSGARMASLYYATGEYMVCLDDDGQCPMDCFWNLFSQIENGFDVSIAKYIKKKQSVIKNIGSYFNKVTTHILLDVDKDFKMTNFFVMKSFVVEKILEYKNPYPFMTGLITRVTTNIAFVQMNDRNRLQGETGYTLKKLISHWLNGFTAFSIKPLRISSFIGAICAFAGFVFMVYTVIRKIVGDNITVGYSSIVAILLFVGGLLMLMLGMIGEYIGRIYICLNNSPQYVVKDVVNIDEKDK